MDRFTKANYNQLYFLSADKNNKNKKERRNSRRSRSHRLDVVLKEQQPVEHSLHKPITVCFAANRSEVGACATFRFRYEALNFVDLLTKAGYWVQIQEGPNETL